MKEVFALGLLFGLTFLFLNSIGLTTERADVMEVEEIRDYEAIGKCKIEASIADVDTRELLPARIIIKASDGSYLDGSQTGQIYSDGRFYAEGSFWVECPPGKVKISVFHGFNYVPVKEKEIEAQAGKIMKLKFYLKKWFEPQKLGWYNGENHWHMHHDPEPSIGTAPDYPFASLVCRAEGLDYATEQGGKRSSFEGASKESKDNFVLRFSPEKHSFFFGHYNIPGVKSDVGGEYLKALLPAQALRDAAHKAGGITIYTHPFCLPLFHWMTAVEVFFDVVLDNYADAFDVFCYNKEVEKLMWFTFLNLGAKLPATASTDACLERKHDKPPGANRVYTYTGSKFTYEAIIENIRKGRNFVTNGPIFVFFTIDNYMVGDTIEANPRRVYQAKIEVHSLYPIKSIELIRNGNVVTSFKDTQGKATGLAPRQAGFGFEQMVEYALKEKETSWYVVKVTDEQGGEALTNPIYFESRARETRGKEFRYAALLNLGNFNPNLTLDTKFFAHIFVAISEGEIDKIVLLRDGESWHEFSPSQGDFNTGMARALKDRYEPYNVWYPDLDNPQYFEAAYPIEESGLYRLKIILRQNKTLIGAQSLSPLLTEGFYFDKSNPNSQQISYLVTATSQTKFEIKASCEDLPLAEVSNQPKYTCWFPKNRYWEVLANFEGKEYRLSSGTRPKAFKPIP